MLNKIKLKEQANKHHLQVLQEKWDLGHNIIYNKDKQFDLIKHSISIPIEILDCDTVSAIAQQNYSTDNCVCALNFASFTNPGGGFLNGGYAQEEAICHSSSLFETLLKERQFYEYNTHNKHNGAYENRLIYSIEVPFYSNSNLFKSDIITCACPNLRPSKLYGKAPFNNREILKSRIEFVLNVAEEQCVNTLILGAWGCGVFMQDPQEVATLFKESLSSGNYAFDKVIFAIPPGQNNKVFRQVFNKL